MTVDEQDATKDISVQIQTLLRAAAKTLSKSKKAKYWNATGVDEMQLMLSIKHLLMSGYHPVD